MPVVGNLCIEYSKLDKFWTLVALKKVRFMVGDVNFWKISVH